MRKRYHAVMRHILLLLGILLWFGVTVTALLIHRHVFEIGYAWSTGGLTGYLRRMLSYRKMTICCVLLSFMVGGMTSMAHERARVTWQIALGHRGKERRLSFLPLWYMALTVILIGCIVTSVRNMDRYEADHAQILQVQQILAEEQRIIHAGGQIEDADGQVHTYTNSVEAMESSLERGARVIEIDIKLTSDMQLVCLHGSKLQDAQGNVLESISEMTLEEVLSCRVDGVFTPMTFEQVIQYMEIYPDLYIVTDAKGQMTAVMKRIAELAGDKIDRIIAQIYHMNTYDKYRNMGFRNIILTLYRAREDELKPEALLSFAQSRQLVGITFKKKYLEDEEIMAALYATGVSLYVHTIDDPDTQQAMFDLGIDAVYTNVVPDGATR